MRCMLGKNSGSFSHPEEGIQLSLPDPASSIFKMATLCFFRALSERAEPKMIMKKQAGFTRLPD